MARYKFMYLFTYLLKYGQYLAYLFEKCNRIRGHRSVERNVKVDSRSIADNLLQLSHTNSTQRNTGANQSAASSYGVPTRPERRRDVI